MLKNYYDAANLETHHMLGDDTHSTNINKFPLIASAVYSALNGVREVGFSLTSSTKSRFYLMHLR